MESRVSLQLQHQATNAAVALQGLLHIRTDSNLIKSNFSFLVQKVCNCYNIRPKVLFSSCLLKNPSELEQNAIEIINSIARHNLTDAKCRWLSNRLDESRSSREPLGQTKVMQIRQGAITRVVCCLAAQWSNGPSALGNC